MLFMVMHKATEATENGVADRAIVKNMGQFIGKTRADGKFRTGAGLQKSSQRVRLRVEGGKRTETYGPLRGENELTQGFAMLEVKSMAEAIDWGTRLSAALGDVEVDVGPVVEAWDLGLIPKPEGDVPLHVLLVHKATAATEGGRAPTPRQRAKLEALIKDMTQAGVLQAIESLLPSASGARLRAVAGKHTWTDGPFAESKELLAGFSIIDVASLAEAKAWTERYAQILGDIEVDVREVQT